MHNKNDKKMHKKVAHQQQNLKQNYSPRSNNSTILSSRASTKILSDAYPTLSFNILAKKYIRRQLDCHNMQRIQKMIRNKNKMTTQLRIFCSFKEYMCRFYSNPIAIIKLRANNEQKSFKTTTALHCFIHLNIDQKLEKIFKVYRKQKINLYSKANIILANPANKNDKEGHRNNNLRNGNKNRTPFMTPPILDDSEGCLKNLVTNIDNMIKFDYQLGQMINKVNTNQINIISKNEYSDSPMCLGIYHEQFTDTHTNIHGQQENKKSLMGTYITGDSIFGEEGRKISQISCTKEYSNQIQSPNKIKQCTIQPKKTWNNHNARSDYIQQAEKTSKSRGSKRHTKNEVASSNKKQTKKSENTSQKQVYQLQSTEPIGSKPANINDQYGILRNPPDAIFRRKQNRKQGSTKKKSSLQNSNSTNKQSSNSKSRKKSASGNPHKKSTKSRECPYQNPNDDKIRNKNSQKDDQKGSNKNKRLTQK